MNPLISTTELQSILNDPRVILLQCGLKDDLPEFAGRRCAGARAADLRGRFRDTTSELPNTFPTPEQFTAAARELGVNQDSRVVLIDNIGVYSSPRLWFLFTAMGHSDVRVLDGGLPSWAAAGLSISDEPEPVYPPGNFTADPAPALVAHYEQVKANVEKKEFTLVDARSRGRFAGTEPEPRAGLRGGHIPGSCSLPFNELLTPGFRSFRPALELRAIFLDVGVPNDDSPLVFSCGSGITASVDMLAARLAFPGRALANYDGSWTEWASREGAG